MRPDKFHPESGINTGRRARGLGGAAGGRSSLGDRATSIHNGNASGEHSSESAKMKVGLEF